MAEVDLLDLGAVSQQYAKFLEHLNIPESKRELLEQQPVDIKRQLLVNHELLFRSQRELYRQDAAQAQMDAFNCVQLLDRALLSAASSPLSMAKLNAIRTQIDCGIQILSAHDDAWLRCFLELRGLDKLVSLMTTIQEDCEAAIDHVEVVLQCTKALLGSGTVLRAMCESVDTVCRLLENLSSKEERITALVVEMVLVIGFYSAQGYDSVLQAFDHFQARNAEPGRFFTFVECLQNDHFSVHLKADAMALINILVGSPRSLNDRMRIRTDFVHAGLVSSIDDLCVMVSILRSNQPLRAEEESQLQRDLAALQKQIEVFHAVAAEDHAKVMEVCEGKDLSNPSVVFELAQKAAAESGQTHHLLQVLHALVVIPSNQQLGSFVWSSVAKACQWLATQPKSACDLSFEEIVERMNDKGLVAPVMSSSPIPAAESESVKDDLSDRSAPKCSTSADSKEYAKYHKMRKLGLPDGAIRHAFEKDGVTPPSGFFQVDEVKKDVPKAKSKAALGKEYEKYARMQKAGLPKGAILNAMKRDSVDPSPFFADENAEKSSQSVNSKRSIDEKYSKYAKMRKAGLPEGAILNAMRRDNVDPSGFDFTTDIASPQSNHQASTPARKVSTGQSQSQKEATAKAKPLLPPKPKVTPQVPMRGLFWSKLEESKVKGSFWEDVQEESLDIKPSLLERMFCQKTVAAQVTPEKAQASTTTEIPGRRERGQSTSKSLKKFQSSAVSSSVELLDPKRQQNLGIAFARYKLSPAEFKRAVIALDLKKIGGMDRVATLDAFVPTQEEKIAIEAYAGDISKLGTIERLFHLVLSIPRFRDRVKSWNIKLKYHIKVAEVQESVQEFDLAVRELHNSQALYKVLEIVLALGNYLNGSSARGGAHGFTLDTLTKLSTVKSVDNQTTLLRFIVAELGANKYKEILRLPKELRHVSEAANLDYMLLQGTIKTLTRDLALVEKELEQCTSCEDPGPAEAAFVESFEPFVARGRKLMKLVQEKFKKLESSFDALLCKFGENPAMKNKSAEFFKTFSTFVKNFAHERQNCLRDEEIQAKRRSKSVSSRKTEQAPSTPRALKPGTSQVFDKMLSSANAGNATDILSEIKKRRKDYDSPASNRDGSLETGKRHVYQSVGAAMSLYKSVSDPTKKP